MDVIIREARREDCEAIVRLKKELDLVQKFERDTVSVEELRRDGFDGPQAYFRCLVAESTKDSQVIGYALWFYQYAAFEGKCVMLEDLCVSVDHRQKGIGTMFFQRLAQICLEEGLSRITLEVLETNTNAIKFYDKLQGRNSTVLDGWVAYLIEKDLLRRLAE